MKPEQIARLLSEDMDPGQTGLTEENGGQQGGDEPPSFQKVVRYIVMMQKEIPEVVKFAQDQNIRALRAAMGEFNGAFEEANNEINALCDKMGLPPLKPR